MICVKEWPELEDRSDVIADVACVTVEGVLAETVSERCFMDTNLSCVDNGQFTSVNRYQRTMIT